MDAITLRNTIFIIGAIIMAIEQGLRSAPEFRSRLPPLIASERWNFAPLILMIVAGAIWVIRSWEGPMRTELARVDYNQPSVVSSSPTPVATWNNIPPNAQGGPIGPILAAEFVYQFGRLPKPCKVRVTATKDNENLASTFSWLLTYGASGGNAPDLCDVDRGNNLAPPNIDTITPIIKPNTDTGIVIHWNESFQPGETIAHWFNADGFNVRISHHMPADSSPNLIWIDIGPGSPWKRT